MRRHATFLLACLLGCSPTVRPEARYVTPSPELCSLESGAESYSSLDSLPKAIAADFLSRLTRFGFEGRSLIAGRDQDFNLSDAVESGLPGRRFVQGGHLGDRWFVWYERGGFAPMITVVAYQLNEMNAKPVLLGLVAQGHYRVRPCEQIINFLNRRGAELDPLPHGL